jgi:hypothetical protein
MDYLFNFLILDDKDANLPSKKLKLSLIKHRRFFEQTGIYESIYENIFKLTTKGEK